MGKRRLPPVLRVMKEIEDARNGSVRPAVQGFGRDSVE